MYIVLLVLGLALGSFVNALVWRLHEQEKLRHTKKKSKKTNATDLSMWRGRSMCPHCHHILAAKDLMPIVSWFWLKGRCRYCHKPISPQYPLGEASLALIYMLSYAAWPSFSDAKNVYSFIFWLILCAGLLALLIYDLRWQLLPNRLIYPLAVIAALQVVLNCLIFDRSVVPLLYSLGGVAVGGGLFLALFYISKGTWIGGGDVRLGALLGLILGTPLRALSLIMLASLLGTLVSLPLIAMKKTSLSSRIPFGPFLIIAAILIQLYATSFLTWYNHSVLLLS